MCFSSLSAKQCGQGADAKGGRSPFILILDAVSVYAIRGEYCPACYLVNLGNIDKMGIF